MGTFVFDSAAAPDSNFPFGRSYFAPSQLFSASVGSYAVSGTIFERINHLPGLLDVYSIEANNGPEGTILLGASVNGFGLTTFRSAYRTRVGPC
jgi:hypothetical protein